MFLYLLNFGFMCLSLYVAFGKPFRPISWSTFYLNLMAAGVNLFAILFRIVVEWSA